MPSEFRTTRRIEFADTDMAGIAHYTNFFRYMEEAEHAFFRSVGLSIVHRADGEMISWPRVSVGCEYFRPGFFEDTLDIRLRVEKRQARALTYVISFFKGDAEIARGRTTAVCCR